MGWYILIFLLFVVLLTFFLRWSNLLLGKVVGKSVYKRHKVTEKLMESDAVPAEWQTYKQEYRRQLRRQPGGNGESAVKSAARAEAEKRAKNHAIEGLEDLRKYFEKAPVFDSRETRKMVLDRIAAVRGFWEKAAWEEMVDPPGRSGGEQTE
jgi:hypothetical protein